MAAPVARAFCRSKLIHGIEWRMFYLILIGCMLIGYLSLWNVERLLLLPVVYFGPYFFFRWAGNHEPQWSEIYFDSLIDRQIWLAGADPDQPDPEPDGKVIFEHPRWTA